MRISHIPTRLVTGAYFVNSGVNKLTADDDTCKGVHEMASRVYPMFDGVEPRTFTKGLGAGELALGGALLLPIVPSWLAGAGLTAFSGGLLGLYFKTPGMTREDGVRPTSRGTALAKDSWLLGIGLNLVIHGLAPGRHPVKRTKREVKRSAQAARLQARARAKEARAAGRAKGREVRARGRAVLTH
jgi:hypothetical protein